MITKADTADKGSSSVNVLTQPQQKVPPKHTQTLSMRRWGTTKVISASMLGVQTVV